jgi:murein DD-endopeptidase MepM/ murein hydrolase activator NlpD
MAKQISSPLITAFNRIGSLGASAKMSKRLQSDFAGFLNFIEVERIKLEKDVLPSNAKIKRLANLNIATTFGRPTNLLSSLASGALDVGGFLGNMFPDKRKQTSKTKTPEVKTPKPTVNGPKLKFGGIRALGVVNAVFAGLDFATGLQEGESVGKAAAGAGGSLAGSLLGGAIGQALIPIPGVGFVIGSMAGGFLGGYAADRAVETGEGLLQQKQKERLKAQEIKQKTLAARQTPFLDVMNRFDAAVSKFENFASGFSLETNEDIGPGTETDSISAGQSEVGSGVQDGATTGDYPGFDNVERVAPFVTGSISDYPGAQFGAPRRGRQLHAGQDIKDQKAGDPVLAAMAGTVIEVGRGARWQNGGGASQTITIKHKDGSMTRYVHVMSNVSPGAEVKTGQKIGTISPADVWSSAGFPHLHFELYNTSGKLIDPRPFLRTAPKTPSIAPIKKGTGVSSSSQGQSKNNNFTAEDLMSAPSLTIGDSIAKGIRDQTGSAGTAQSGANPAQVLDMLKNQNLKGKLLKLSSGISNNTSDLASVREQLKYAQSQGAKGVQLMGTSVDRGDLAGLNPKLQALAKEFPGFVQFTGGFNAADQIHPNYAKYNEKMQSMLKGGVSPGMGGPSVDVSKIETKTLENLRKMEYYPTYNQAQSSMTIVPIAVGSNGQQKPVVVSAGGGVKENTIVFAPPSSGEIASELLKTMLLTNLSAS